MSLPSLLKTGQRDTAVTIRLSKESVEQLKTLAKAHNISQADVVEHLLHIEFVHFQKSQKKQKK
jgi:predicted transcriptional regulator